MSLLPLLRLMLLPVVTLAADPSMLVVTVLVNQTVRLNCTAPRKPGVDYRSVRWYKEGGETRLTGLVSRTPPSSELQWYVDADTRVSMELGTLSLLLPPVNCSHAGVYQCYLAAPVGQQNREGRVRLSVLDCPTEPPTTPSWTERLMIDPGPTLGQWKLEPNDEKVLIYGAVTGISLAMIILLMLLLKNRLSRSKASGKEPFPLEKEELLWTLTPEKTGKVPAVTPA